MKISTILLFILLASCSKLKIESPGRKFSHFNPLWVKNLDPSYETGNLPIGLGSPLIYQDLVYMGGLDGKMRAYNLGNGRLVWKSGKGPSISGQGVIFKNILVYGDSEGNLNARDGSTGKVKYVVNLGASIESKPTIYRGRIYVHLRNHKIFCLDAETGKILWAYKRSVPFTTTIQRVSEPLPYKNKIIVGFADGNLVAFSAEDGVLSWEKKIARGTKFIDVDAKPIILKNKLFIGAVTGSLNILNPDNGNLIRKVPITIPRRPYPYKKGLIAGSSEGHIVLLSGNGDVVHQKKIVKGGVTNIVEWNKKLAVSTTSGKILLVNPIDFSIEDQFDLGSYASSVLGRMESRGNKLAVYSSRNRLYVFSAR
jgi:outer membrane protein assembly factor BamB